MFREDEENIEEELPAFVGLDPLYNSIRPIYDADSANTEYEHVDNYEESNYQSGFFALFFFK